MTINLRTEFLQVLKDSGWNIYLQRRTNDTGKNQFTNTLEIHTVRNRFGSSSVATGLAREQPEGVGVSPDNIFYFKWDVNPGEGDRIYEEMPNQTSNTAVWLIDYAQPFRGFDGQIVYWICGCTREELPQNSTVGPGSGAGGTPLPSPPDPDSTDYVIDGGEV
jgi:hypothetical protein